MSSGVRQRTREIGTRMAIGATGWQITWLVLRRGAGLTGVGVAAGTAASLVLGSALTPLLFQTSSSDPLILAGSAAALAAVALLACLVPAARAARLDPARLLDQQG
jgi:ABC-type antimicrobial peptide transport system permease subunit